MADNLDHRGPQDRARINVNETWEVDYWTRALGVSEAKLIDAVMAVGSSADDVRRYLARQKAN
jgi:hypothetical protein